MNPEFLREGKAIEDFSQPDRIVLGHEDSETLRLLQELYSSWEVDKLAMNSRSAELVKYVNNALLATQISVINELANLSSKLGGIDFGDVCAGVHLDKRWSPILDSNKRVYPEILSYLIPGCGFGGSCLPKDVQALKMQGQELGVEMQLLNAVLDINGRQPSEVSTVLNRQLGTLVGRKILILGLSFKAGTDDVRDSPTLKIIPDLISQGAKLLAHDPIATAGFKDLLGAASSDLVIFVQDWIKAVDGVEIIMLTTGWEQYQQLSELNISDKIVFDCRGLFDKNSFRETNFD
jgi:UDPglucose 6-dehydrogenase/GDP-mannose 6-dehydrogenase